MRRDRRKRTRPASTRRHLLRAGAVVGGTALAGCSGIFGGDATDGNGGTTRNTVPLETFRGSGLGAGQRSIGGTRIEELPALSGEMTIYLGGGEGGLYLDLLDLFKRIYPDFTPRTRPGPTAQLANTIIEETQAGTSRADVFWAVDVGALGVVAGADATVSLPAAVVEPVPENFHPNDQWVGVAGRARAVPYNTDQLSASDIPNDVMAFPESPVPGVMGWAPTYGAYQSFVTAMRILEGEDEARDWLSGMRDGGISAYPDEFLVSNAVADGEIGAGFANHYYALRVKAARPDAPIDLTFTKNDAASLINAAGAAIIAGTEKEDLAVDFVRHLLSTEAQEFFATRTFAYPMVSDVPPAGGLPPIDELDPPEIDLTKLSNLQPTLELLRETGVL